MRSPVIDSVETVVSDAGTEKRRTTISYTASRSGRSTFDTSSFAYRDRPLPRQSRVSSPPPAPALLSFGTGGDARKVRSRPWLESRRETVDELREARAAPFGLRHCGRGG